MDDIKLMEAIESDISAGEGFYSLAMKIPLNEVINLLLNGYSFNEAFSRQEHLLNVICAEKKYIELLVEEKNIDIKEVFHRLELNLVKRIYNYVRNNVEFDLSTLNINLYNCVDIEINNKIRTNFNNLITSLNSNNNNWLMRCLAFKQYRNIIKKELRENNKLTISKINEKNIFIVFDN